MTVFSSHSLPSAGLRPGHRLTGTSFGVALSFLLSNAAAQTAETISAPSTEKPHVPAKTTDELWIPDYLAARELMLEGKFGKAKGAFELLIPRANDSQQERLAIEMSRLAKAYVERKLTVVSEEELRVSELGAKTSGHRSTDEIALLYINSVLYGIGTGGWIAALSNSGSTAGVILPMLGVSALGAGAIFWADHNDSFRYGVPQSIISGMYLGLTQGVLWSGHFGQNGYVSSAAAASAVWGGATAGAILGGVLGHNLGTTPGRSSWVGSSALWSAAFTGFAVAAGNRDGDFILLGAAIGHGVGTIGGLLTAGKIAPSIARVRFIDLGTLATGFTGAGLYAAAAGDSFNPQAFAGISAGSVAAGAILSYFLTERMAKDFLPEEKDSTLASIRTGLTPLEGGGLLEINGNW